MPLSGLKPSTRTELQARAEGHTPTPWKAITVTGGWDGVGPSNGGVPICNLAENNPANAAFIVLACNSHDAMVAALELARAYLSVSLGSPTWTGENPYPIIDSALDLAKGKTP